MDEPSRPPLLSLWDLAALLALGALGVFLLQMLPSLPDPVPTHFDALGRANGWTPRSSLPWVVLGIPTLVWATLTAICMGMAAAQPDPLKARAAAAQPLRGLLGTGLAIFMGLTLLAPASGPRIVLAGLGILLALVAIGLAFQVRDYRRIAPDPGGRDPYKWGIFYVDPEDPRILVEKRLGIGWTLNFGRPASYAILALVLLLPLVLSVALAFRR